MTSSGPLPGRRDHGCEPAPLVMTESTDATHVPAADDRVPTAVWVGLDGALLLGAVVVLARRAGH